MFQTFTFFGTVFLGYLLTFMAAAFCCSRKWKVTMVVLVTLWTSYGSMSMANTIGWNFWFFDQSLNEIAFLAENGKAERLQPVFEPYFQENQWMGIAEMERLCFQISQEARAVEPPFQPGLRNIIFSGPISTNTPPFWFPNWRNFPTLLLLHVLAGTVLLMAAIFAKRPVFVLLNAVCIFTAAFWLWACNVHAQPHYGSCRLVLASIHEAIGETHEDELATLLKNFPRPPFQVSAYEFYMSPEGQALLNQLASDLSKSESSPEQVCQF